MKGIAVAGAVEVSPFVEVPRAQRQALLRVLNAPIREAQWAAVRRAATPSPQGSPDFAQIWATLTRHE
jgi:hypothetical protein